MVIVSFKPWEEVIIHEVIEHKIQDFVRLRVTGLRQGAYAEPLMWAEGVAFSRTVMPPTQDVIREQIEGKIHFLAIEWAIMPRYKSVVRSGGVTIPIINVMQNLTLREVAKELKKTRKRS